MNLLKQLLYSSFNKILIIEMNVVCFQRMDTEEADIAQLCAQNIVLWEHFLEAFSGRDVVHRHLAQIHHQLRVSYALRD